MEDEEDDLFDWAAQAYSSNNSNLTPTDLSQYEVYLGSIQKEPTGEETLIGFTVRNKVTNERFTLD